MSQSIFLERSSKRAHRKEENQQMKAGTSYIKEGAFGKKCGVESDDD
jgi:hypothetical protein